MSRTTKLIVDQLIADLRDRPADFVCSEYTLDDSKTNMSYWVANGRFSAGIYTPYKLWFGFIQGYRFHNALTKWKAVHMITKSQMVKS